MKHIRSIIFISACLFGLSACHKDEVDHQEAVKYVVTSPLRTDTSIVHEYVCQIHAIQHIEIRALERGYLEKILVDEGKVVRKGQLMFQILPTIYEADFSKAEAEAKAAEIEYLNTKALADKNVVSKNELAIMKAKLDRAKAEMGLAQAHLNFTRIKAPFTGIMDRLHVRVGSLLEEGEMLTALSDNSQMWVYFNVPESQYLNYKAHTPTDSTIAVDLRMANNQIFPHKGLMTTIEGDFNNETGNIAFRATFPNPSGLLRHGETGNILMTEPLKNVLLIPQKATYEVLEKIFVYVVDAKNVVRSREVKIKAELQHVYAVEGVAEGERVLIEGLRKVRENQIIEYTFIPPTKVLPTLELEAE
ncbi:MAG: efflux RND transporter periplasmic adaptor subunit [Bacteroidota bacterium]|jgi:membrane fusion protein (multidrug efflux system)